MTDVLPPSPPPPPHDRIEPRGLEVEMQQSYLDYAMSVIVGRALPDVRDGLKPVHRRVLYAMYDGGYRPDRGYFKCARVVGDVMGNYHPHGDTAIYDTLVRLAQPWSMRYPMIDGNGNFGSAGDDPAAAMRYCAIGETRVRMASGASPRMDEVLTEVEPDNDLELTDVKLLNREGNPVAATRGFHSGSHPTLRLRTREGYELTGTHNHPVLCLVDVFGVPMLQWKLLEEVRSGDWAVLYRGVPADGAALTENEVAEALVAGALLSEGWTSGEFFGFDNTDRDLALDVAEAFEVVFGRRPSVGHEMTITGRDLVKVRSRRHLLESSGLHEIVGLRSADKFVPSRLWSQGAAFKRAFLQALFEGDGSCSRLATKSLQVSYSTRSPQLARDVQQLLLELGVISRLALHATGETKVYLSNRCDVRLFADRVGFWGRKQTKLRAMLASLPEASAALGQDHVPFVAAYLRAEGATDKADRDWLARHNVDRIGRWERGGDLIRAHVTNDEALRVVEPLVTGLHYYAQVATVEDAGVQPVFSFRVDSEEHAFLSNGFVSHNTECRLQPAAMEMLRDIDQETVEFSANYDGRSSEPDVLPSRIPNLLVNGSSGIAVGMATNIPPHNLREVAAAVQWLLEHPQCSSEELLQAALERVQGPDFPTGALIVGRDGITDAYRTGRGSVRMRAVVDVDTDARDRSILVITELPYQVNPDSLATSIADLVRDGRLGGIADVRDEGSARTGQRLVIVLKRDAVAKVVLNNLYKHTQLQTSFGANMLSIVDGVPRTLRLDEMIQCYVGHQVEVIVRRTRYRLRRATERAHILRALGKALDHLDEVIALIRGADSADAARSQLMALLEIDETQAVAILDMQLRRLAALERQRILDELAEREAEIADLQAILADEGRQRRIIAEELAEIVDKYGDDRRTRIIAYEGDMSAEDLIAQEDVVVSVTRGGYAKRTKTELYRQQRRGGKGVRGAALKQDDIVEHFFVTTTHHWILFFTNQGRVYRAKAHELTDAARDARGSHVANVLAFQPDEHIAQVLDIPDYQVAPYLVLATRQGQVKKTRLPEYDNGRSSGLIAINLREGDELIAAALIGAEDDVLLVTRNAQAVRFTADGQALRPMGRATSGVRGVELRAGDQLLAMVVASDPEETLLVVTDTGMGKRSRLADYPVHKRGGFGVRTLARSEAPRVLVGALIVRESDEVFLVTNAGVVIRFPVAAELPRTLQRATAGVRLVSLEPGGAVLSAARNGEAEAEVAEAEALAELAEAAEAAEVAEVAEATGGSAAPSSGEVSGGPEVGTAETSEVGASTEAGASSDAGTASDSDGSEA